LRSVKFRHKNDGNWYEGMRELQAIMFDQQYFTQEQAEQYLNKAWRSNDYRQVKIYDWLGKKKLRRRVTKRHGKVYYHYQIGDPNDHVYCKYQPEYPQQGIVEITAIDDMGR
ncbi:MAG TPA: hypothetical protein PLS50_08735, partial [Candidatus Dojkabacteria bacterium]|nr:hypothetical protein [Candidatus Dojkabacteria bacterium]